MDAKEAGEIREQVAEQQQETVTESEPSNQPKRILPKSAAQTTSLEGGSYGQAVGLPRPVTQADLDEQERIRAIGPAKKPAKKEK